MALENSMSCLQQSVTGPYPQIDSDHAFPSQFSKNHLKIILPSMSWSSSSLSFWFPHQNPSCNLLTFYEFYMSCPSNSPRLDQSNYTWRIVRITKLLIMELSPTSFTSPLVGQSSPFSKLFVNNLSLCSSVEVRDQVSHP